MISLTKNSLVIERCSIQSYHQIQNKGFLGLKNKPDVEEIEKFMKSNTHFLLIDEYGNCMKVTDDILDLDMMSKFLNGPEIVHTPDDLFE